MVPGFCQKGYRIIIKKMSSATKKKFQFSFIQLIESDQGSCKN